MDKNGIAIIRTPNPSEKDPSELDIRNLLSLSSDEFDKIIVFEDKFGDIDGVESKNVIKKEGDYMISQLLYNVLFQMKLSIELIKKRRSINTTLWHVGNPYLVIPITVSKLLNFDILVCVLGRATDGYLNDDYWERQDIIWGKIPLKYAFAILLGTLETFVFLLSSRIAVFSENIKSYLTLAWFEQKILTVRFNYQHIPDTKPVESRKYPLIYMGRICDLKGADRVANAIQIIEQNHDFEAPILFVGDGNMRSELEAKLESNDVRFTGWLPKRDALQFLADSKIFVLPSRSEGLPKALLEAMARGTVPVVTPVGDIPNVVSNDNGYILENPRSERLADTIVKASKTDQTKKSNQAIETIRKEHSYKRAKHDFEKLIGYTDSPPQE